jgi:PII-like signaling protein
MTSEMIPQEGALLRIFIGEDDRVRGRAGHGKPLYEWLVLEARRSGLAGATVLRGILGYGASSRLHTWHVERLSQDMPMIVELVDSEERLLAFLAQVEPELQEGLATLEKANVRLYRARNPQ